MIHFRKLKTVAKNSCFVVFNKTISYYYIYLKCSIFIVLFQFGCQKYSLHKNTLVSANLQQSGRKSINKILHCLCNCIRGPHKVHQIHRVFNGFRYNCWWLHALFIFIAIVSHSFHRNFFIFFYLENGEKQWLTFEVEKHCNNTRYKNNNSYFQRVVTTATITAIILIIQNNIVYPNHY